MRKKLKILLDWVGSWVDKSVDKSVCLESLIFWVLNLELDKIKCNNVYLYF